MQDDQPQNNRCSIVQSIKNFFINKEHEACRNEITCLGLSGCGAFSVAVMGSELISNQANGYNCTESCRCIWLGLFKENYCCDPEIRGYQSLIIGMNSCCVLSGITGTIVPSCSWCCKRSNAKDNNKEKTMQMDEYDL